MSCMLYRTGRKSHSILGPLSATQRFRANMRLHSFSASLALLLGKGTSSFVVTYSGQAALHRPSLFVARSALLFPASVRFASSSPSKICLRMADASESTSALPTIEQAAKDPFMSQLSHAHEICSLLESSSTENDAVASDLLKAQLSHSDGIRGFFATYLTGEGDNTAADREEIPAPLVGAMEGADMDVLVPLACMNVVMPTAMTSMHTDPELSANAARTARRGTRVLKWLEDKNGSVSTNCKAILAAATGENTDDCIEERVEYWTKFFSNYSYEEEQKKDIAEAMQEVL